MLTGEERVFLRTLQEDGRWVSIMKKLRRKEVTPYKPGESAEGWIYESGQVRENRKILTILSGVEDE